MRGRVAAYLIIYGPKVYIGLERLASDATCQHILPCVTKTIVNKNSTHVFDLRISALSVSYGRSGQSVILSLLLNPQKPCHIEVFLSIHLPVNIYFK